MKKAILAVILIISFLFPVIPVESTEQLNIEDTATSYKMYNENLGLVYDLSGSSAQKASPFTYDIPDGGAAVIVFFRGNGECRNSNDFMTRLSNTMWANDDSVNLIAIESTKVGRDALKNYMDTYDPNGFVDRVYYNDAQNYVVAWYLESISRGGNMDGVNKFSVSIAFPHILIVTKENGVPMIKYSVSGIYDTTLITSLIGTVADIPDGKNNAVEVDVSGTEKYDFVLPVLDAVNANRAKEGLEPLTISSVLTDIAMERAAECSVFYSHVRPNGYSCFSLGNGTGRYPTGLLIAENIAVGMTNPLRAVEVWMNSPGHRKNILRDNITQLGVGCFEKDGAIYWVQVFGNGSDSAELFSEDEIEVQYTIETLESRIGSRMPHDSIIVPLCSGNDIELSVNVSNVGVDPSFTYITSIIPQSANVYGADGELIAYLEGGVLHCIKEGVGTLELALYEGDPLSEAIPLTVTDHSWVQRGTVVEPTYTEPGEAVFICSVCGAEKRDVLPRLISNIPGDLNGDGELTMKDVLKARRIIAGLDEPDERFYANADFNGDGDLTMADVLIMRRVIAGLSQI